MPDVFACPRCQVQLVAFEYEGVQPAMCSTCRGIFFSHDDLLHSGRQLLAAVNLAEAAPSDGLSCPADSELMESRALKLDKTQTVIDRCEKCGGLWFDGGELATLRKVARRHAFKKKHPPPRDGLGPPVGDRDAARAQAQALLEEEEHRLATNPDEAVARSGPAWFWIAFFTSLPLEGYNPVHRFPAWTWLFIVSCLVVFAIQLSQGMDGSWLALALVPSKAFTSPGGLLTLVTSILLHGDILHLLGNLYFLKIFGDNVEDRLGRVVFPLFFLGSGLVASLCHTLTTAQPDMPVVGASGAISGLLGAYLLFFPDVRVSIAPFFLVLARRFRLLHLRALFFLPIWLLLQLLHSVIGVPGVAWSAHIGGFLGGLGLAYVLKQKVPDARIAYLAERFRAGEHIPPVKY